LRVDSRQSGKGRQYRALRDGASSAVILHQPILCRAL
jgi:hypothetical protein